ncbi:DUF5134 domain-containing protein [Streptomyces sp. NPDC052236]|uniref:DUF5134 domain-containing protein n=1 Tax=Streptomyces sp. NPDC052236 TaxID=3365686 RepID=UPI0037D4BC5C
MHGPAVSCWLLVALCGAIGAYCLLRMRGCSGQARAAAGGEALMGFGMAAMALPATVLVLPEWGWLVYAAIFGGAALRAVWPARHGVRRLHAHHLVGSLSMVHMAIAMTYGGDGGGGGAGHGTGHAEQSAAGVELLTGVLLAYYAGYVLRSGVRLIPAASPVGGAAAATDAWDARPELARACGLAMGLAMLAMLLIL